MTQTGDRKGAQTRTEAFRLAYDQAKTYADLETALRTLDTQTLEQFIQSTQTTQTFMGLDMRQETALEMAKSIQRMRDTTPPKTYGKRQFTREEAIQTFMECGITRAEAETCLDHCPDFTEQTLDRMTDPAPLEQ